MNFLGDPFKLIKPRFDDSGVDRLNYYYTPVVIIIMALTLTAKQYVGEPLQCWVPAQFSRAWEQYAENYCFVFNTYFVGEEEEIPRTEASRTAAQLIYYQWVPFIMVIEAGLFHFPVKIWSLLSRTSGLNLAGMIAAVVKAEQDNDESKLQSAALTVCHLLENSNKMRKLRTEGASTMRRYARLGELDGTYLSNLYFGAKVIYCINSILQFASLNKFLAQDDIFWGVSILRDLVLRDWRDSKYFPRVTICDFDVRTMGNMQRCEVYRNHFSLLTLIDSLTHFITMRMPSRRQRFVKRFISCPPEEKAVLEDFTREFLNPDMFLILKMIDGHTSEIVTETILQQLYDNFRNSNETLNEHPYLRHLDLARQESEFASDAPLSNDTTIQEALLKTLQISSPGLAPSENFGIRRFSMTRSPISR
ncbi:hypothetical protein PMAYCL1PPCAC_24102 [Pristionchus mayeri]|uniref:Innexin n=1 Tax=Pristionchus mayeri TaxID=1317129 RepID=A0AAN5I669_9BILA|nr:hypothetical protein PMAYCL1PPCAC_24102 [Pristionchus mayeri]